MSKKKMFCLLAALLVANAYYLTSIEREFQRAFYGAKINTMFYKKKSGYL